MSHQLSTEASRRSRSPCPSRRSCPGHDRRAQAGAEGTPGDVLVRLLVLGDQGRTLYELPDYPVDPSSGFVSEIKQVLGPAAVA